MWKKVVEMVKSEGWINASGARRVLYFQPDRAKRKSIEDLHKSPIKITCLKQSTFTEDFIFTDKTEISKDDVQLDFEPLDMEKLLIAQAKKFAIEIRHFGPYSFHFPIYSVEQIFYYHELKYQNRVYIK